MGPNVLHDPGLALGSHPGPEGGINDAPALMQADVGIAAGGGTDIAADIVLLRDELTAVLDARDISARSYQRTRSNVALAFTFNGIGVPLATTGLVYPVWAMVAMAASVTAIFLDSIGTRPSLLFEAVSSVGRQGPSDRADEHEEAMNRAA